MKSHADICYTSGTGGATVGAIGLITTVSA